MNSVEFAEAINIICGKLGIAADAAAQIVPRLARARIAEQGTIIITLLLLSVSLGFVCKKLYSVAQRYADNNGLYSSVWDVDWFLLFFAIIFVGIVVCLAVVVILLPDVIGWIVSPDAKAILYVINQIGG